MKTSSDHILQSEFPKAFQYHQAGKLDQAEKCYLTILEAVPKHPDTNHLYGLICHIKGESDKGIEHIQAAIRTHPDHPVYLYNLGKILQDLGRHDEAADCFTKVLNIKPDYVQAHNNLGLIHKARQNHTEAFNCFKRSIRTQPGFPEPYNNIGIIMSEQNRYEEALHYFLKYLDLNPNNVSVIYNTGLTFLKLGQFKTAVDHFQKAISLKPGFTDAYCSLGVAFRKLSMPDEAMSSFQKALEVHPGHPDALCNMGTLFKVQGEIETARTCFEKSIQAEPDNPLSWCNIGIIHKENGEFEKAISCFEQALSINADFIEAYYEMADLKLGEHYENYTAHLEKLVQQKTLSPAESVKLLFSLGMMFHDLGKYDRAFHYYRTGNELRQKICDPDFTIEKFESRINTYITCFAPSFYSTWKTKGSKSRKPIFIVGMPRSGTTLVEQILSCHPLVFGAGELDYLSKIEKDILCQSPDLSFKEKMFSISQEQFLKMAEEYLNHISSLSDNSPRVTDKMPQNFYNLWLVHLMFPESKIVHCRRNPLDTCLSAYFQNFTGGHGYKRNLFDLGRYYLLYEKIMSHWKAQLPMPIFEIEYEYLVSKPEETVRNLLTYLDLEWEGNCIHFHKNKRRVRTASAFQVRQNIYTDSINRWKPYEHHLAPLIDLFRKENISS